MSYVFKRMPSPVGTLTLIASGDKLCAILWENERLNRVRIGPLQEDIHSPLLQETERQLQQYFAGEREHFDLPLDFVGTEFQQKVWQALLTIPFGETRSYSQIAEQIGSPKAVRAVGAAVGRNPLSVVVPCHRVVGTDGSLTGYAGGLDRKKSLLNLENAAVVPVR